MQKWLKMTHFWPKNDQNFFLKKRYEDIFQYWSVFSGISGKSGQYLVNILGKSGQYSGQYTDFFLQTTVAITENDQNVQNFGHIVHIFKKKKILDL